MAFIQDTLHNRDRKETIRTISNVCQVILTLSVLIVQLYNTLGR